MSGTENNYVEIYLSYNEIEAELIKGLLEENGISAMVRAMLISPYPINIGSDYSAPKFPLIPLQSFQS